MKLAWMMIMLLAPRASSREGQGSRQDSRLRLLLAVSQWSSPLKQPAAGTEARAIGAAQDEHLEGGGGGAMAWMVGGQVWLGFARSGPNSLMPYGSCLTPRLCL